MYSTYNRTRMYLYIKKQKLKNKDILNLKKKGLEHILFDRNFKRKQFKYF